MGGDGDGRAEEKSIGLCRATLSNLGIVAQTPPESGKREIAMSTECQASY